MGTLKIGSAKNMVGVTIDPRTVLFNDNNVKYIKSGLTEIWSYIKPLVPKMTSNTTPYGEASASSTYDSTNYLAYFAFDDNDKTVWASSKTDSYGRYLCYKFVSPTVVKRMSMYFHTLESTVQTSIFKIQASNNNSTWIDLTDNLAFTKEDTHNGNTVYYDINNDNAYLYYRVYTITPSFPSGEMEIGSLQYYGSQLKGLVPRVTSNISSDGEVVYSTEKTGNEAYRLFDGYDDTRWYSKDNNLTNQYVGFIFKKSLCVKAFSVKNYSNVQCIPYNYTVEAYNGSKWIAITGQITSDRTANKLCTYIFENNNYYSGYRILMDRVGSAGNVIIGEMQFYG